MDLLSAEEARVLGVLIEKEVSTPDYYPLSMNALVNACNQKSNRLPVVHYEEGEVSQALSALRDKGLAVKVVSGDSRVPKYAQIFTRDQMLTEQEIAVLCELMLRGPQTPGELRSRTHRLYDFDGLDEVEMALESLASRENEPYLIKLPRQPGRKEHRYCHLLCGEPEVDVISEPLEGERRKKDSRIEDLEEEITQLKRQVAQLQEAFSTFKSQFD